MEIYFLSSNKYKIKEVSDILGSTNIQIKSFNKKINEIQSDNMVEIVTDKVIKGFKEIGRPIIVEQTGLLIKDFGDLPGGLTQVFWDSLEADNFSKFFSKKGTASATAKTIVAFCDGEKNNNIRRYNSRDNSISSKRKSRFSMGLCFSTGGV